VDENGHNSSHDEAEILTALGTTEYAAAFDATALQLGLRGEKLGHQRGQAKRLVENLFKRTINTLGAEVLAGLISGLDARDARHLTYEHPHLLSTIVEAKPSLAQSPQLWVGADNSKWEVFDRVAKRKDLNDEVVKGIIWALLESNSDDLFRKALNVWGERTVFGAMDWLDKTEGIFNDNIRGSLTFHTRQVMNWVAAETPKSPKGLICAAHILAPYSYQISDVGTRIWEKLEEKLGGYEKIYLSAFLLALGLCNSPDDPMEQIRKHFDTIYQLAWDEKLDSSIWEILEPIVPEIPWPNNWDRCERMVRGLIISFVKYGWPPQKIYHCVSQTRIWDRFPKSAKKVDGGVEFMKKLL